MNSRGASIIQLVIASAISASAIGGLFAYVNQQYLITTQVNKRLVAKGYAADLIEMFRSMSPAEFRAYLDRNPITGVEDVNNYRLCRPANFDNLAPSGRTVQFPDPIARLPATAPFGTDYVNRSYDIKVANVRTMQAIETNPPCDRTVDSVTLGPDEVFLVTVKVAWNEDRKNEVVVSAILPPSSGAPPAVDLKANGADGPLIVAPGSSVTLTWTSNNATACTLDDGTTTTSVGLNNSTGQVFSNVTANTTFALTCSRAGAANAVDTVLVTPIDPCSTTNPMGGVITFETLPGGATPTHGMAITTQYQSSHGVAFSLEGGGATPMAIRVGVCPGAFQCSECSGNQCSMIRAGNLGQWFLTDDRAGTPTPKPLIVRYNRPVSKASGILIDVDHSERWTIRARNASNQVVGTVVLQANEGDYTYDGKGLPFSFNHGSTKDIYSIRISGVKQNGSPAGIAFDHFSPSEVCPPP